MSTDLRVRRTRHLSLIARVGVAIVASVWAFHGTDWAELAKVFQRRDFLWYFALTLIMYGVAQLVIAFRWWVLLRAQSIHIRIAATFRLHFIGLFYNNVMPGSVGGDLLKAWYVAKHTHRRLEGALSVLVDRVVGLSGMLLMAIVAYLLFMRGRVLEATANGAGGFGRGLARYGGAMVWVVAVIAVAAAGVLLHRRGRARTRELAAKAWERGRSLLGRIRQAMVVYCSKPLTMLYALVLTLIGQSVAIVAFWLLGRNLGVSAGLRDYFVIFPVTWVIGAIPVSIAGLGVVEMGIIELFKLTAATEVAAKAIEDGAKALALCQRFVWVLASLPGGVVHLVGGHLPKDFMVDVDNTAN